MDWHQLWEIASAPDNVPILMLGLLVPFYTWYAMRQAFQNDRIIARLDVDQPQPQRCAGGKVVGIDRAKWGVWASELSV